MIHVNKPDADVQYVAPRNPFNQTPNRSKITVLRMYEHYVSTGLRFGQPDVLDECKRILAQYRAARITGRTFTLRCAKHNEPEAHYLAHIVQRVYERTCS